MRTTAVSERFGMPELGGREEAVEGEVAVEATWNDHARVGVEVR